jgi:DNA polymerase III delta subunit
MLYVIYGTDIDKAREKSHALFNALKEKKPDASAGSLSAENISAEKIEELTQTQGLFENKQIIFMDRTLENKDVREVMLDQMDAIAESPNIFIFSEGKLTKDVLKKLEKRAEKITEYELDTEKPKDTGSIFAIADALGSRDKKSFWLRLREALDKDEAPEAIHGILFWKAKMLALSPNAYWKKGDADTLLTKLVSMYHRAHRGEVDFELELEKLALDL